MADLDLRFTPALHVKLAGASEGEIVGTASPFGGAPDAYGDIIAAGSFQKSIADHKARGTMPAMLWAHRMDQPIGRWLSVAEDSRGLKVEGRFNLETTAGREAYAHVKAGDVTGLSIGFNIAEGGHKRNPDGTTTLTEIILHEVSVVAVPAAPTARITSVKSIQNKREFEEALRDLGFPKAAAARLSAKGWAGLEDRDDADSIEALIKALNASTLKARNL